MIKKFISWIRSFHFHNWEAIEEQRVSGGWVGIKYQCTKCRATKLDIDMGW